MYPLGINGGTWSLTVEMLLYFLFHFLMLIFAGEKGKKKILVIIAIMLVLISYNAYIDKSDYIYANPVFRTFDFMCGIGFYFAKENFTKVKFADFINLIIIALLAFICIHCESQYQYMNGQFIITPLLGLWIVIVYHSKSKFYNNKIMEYLGKIRYSFYLWQFVAMEVGKKLIQNYPDISFHFVVIIAFIINFIISVVSYHLLEEKTRNFIVKNFLIKKAC